MFRFIKEFFNKGLKCERLGHIPETKIVKIRKEDNGLNCLMKDYEAEIDYCERCYKPLTEPKIIKQIDWYNSVSMPNSRWQELREKGYLIIH